MVWLSEPATGKYVSPRRQQSPAVLWQLLSTVVFVLTGQGYIWLAHRDPASPSWPLARRSKALWEQLAAHAHTNDRTNSLADNLEWQVSPDEQ